MERELEPAVVKQSRLNETLLLNSLVEPKNQDDSF